MNIKKLNEEFRKFFEDNNTAWEVIAKSGFKNILDLGNPFIFYFGDTIHHFTAEKLNIEQLKSIEGKKGPIFVLNNWYYALYENGKYIGGNLFDEDLNTSIPIDSNLIYVKINAPLRKFTKDDKTALKIGVEDVTQPYGSNSNKCCEYMKKYKIDPDTKYVVQGDVMAASRPYLYYNQKKGFTIIIGQHGKGFYHIPVTQFQDCCKPETKEDVNQAAFIAAQD